MGFCSLVIKVILPGILLGINFLFGFVAPEFKASRITRPPVIDGYLDDPCWQEATRIDDDFRNWDYYDPEYGKIAPVKTIVHVGYDDENLYFGIICEEPHIEELRAETKSQSRFYGIVLDDHIKIFLNTFVTRTEEYIFIVNANGIRSDWFQVEEKPGLYSYADYANIVWYADAKILDSCWTVEVQIPFQSLRFPSTYIDYWRIDISRVVPRKYRWYYHWSPMVRGLSCFTYYARMYIEDRICGPRRVELLPYGVGGLSSDSGAVGVGDWSLRSGLSGKYFFNYDNVVDFAVLPDFSQIESDAPQIDVNTTFALYTPEKRPFFTARKTFFETPLEVFYSRMINDPVVAVKYTGSIRDYALGYICAYDRHSPFIVPFAERSFSFGSDRYGLSNIIRVKRTIMKDTHLGFLATGRDFLVGGFNRVFGLDGAWPLWGDNGVRVQGLVSWTEEPVDTELFSGYGLNFDGYTGAFDGEEFIGEAFWLELNHRGRHIIFDGYLQGLSPTFRAGSGFISYNDYTKFGFSLDYRCGLKRYFIESVTPGIRFAQTHRYFGVRSGINRGLSVNFRFKYLVSVFFSYQLLDRSYQGSWFNGLWFYNSNICISTIKHITLSYSVNYGRQIDYNDELPGVGNSLSSSLMLNLTWGRVYAGVSYYQYLFWYGEYGDWKYNQRVFEVKLSYAFTRYLNLRLLSQYNSETKRLLFAPLISFTPTALTSFYLGANHNFTGGEEWLDLHTYHHTGTNIFLKVQYMFRF